jgi:hypothetical protein
MYQNMVKSNFLQKKLFKTASIINSWSQTLCSLPVLK